MTLNKGTKRTNKTCIYTKLAIILLLCFYVASVDARNGRESVVRGKIKDASSESLEYVSVYIKDSSLGTHTDEKGDYFLRIPPGTHIICAHLIGYETFEKKIEVKPAERIEVDIRLTPGKYELEAVEVVSKSMVQQINETAYNVVALDAKALHNTTLDLAHALDRISGVKIKEQGGLGSSTQIYLNGFTGRHIKIFMDGVPMEGRGSSFGLNNIPINMAERIEVYKGVVPVELGGDAIGGAINIVTKNTSNTFLDASYSFGSFNTHRSNISLGHTMKNGLSLELNAYQNYSDNNYKIKSNLLNVEDGTLSKEEFWFKRFHDTYHNEAIIGKIGVRNKAWATRLMLEMTYSQEYDEMQNANLMKIVYGGIEEKSKTYSPSLVYEKRNLFTENLNFYVTGRYNKVTKNHTDTLARQYNWKGEYINSLSKGEFAYSLSESTDKNGYITVNASYKIGENHFLALNNVYNDFSRRVEDPVANPDEVTEGTTMRRVNKKDVFGLSYRFSYNDKLNASAFVKYYNVHTLGPVNVSSNSHSKYEEQEKNVHKTGYGIAAGYLLIPSVQVKTSYEHAYRLPSENELFGDNALESGNAILAPEKSNNVNLNLSYHTLFNKDHSVYLDAGLFYRNTFDYIRRTISDYGGAKSENHGRVLTTGADLEGRYTYKNKFSLGGNLTTQSIRNRVRFSSTGDKLLIFNDRMPNVPYFFSNVDASYNFYGVSNKNDILTIGYTMQHIYQFFRSWQSEGAKIKIPSQLSHDLSLHYSLKNGRYNIALEAKNITDEILYDNYSLQKPGRSLNVKVRYFFYKSKE